MDAISGPPGLNNALNTVSGGKQPGPPDHAKAWGWRARQAAVAEAQPPSNPAVAPTTETGATPETELSTKAPPDTEVPPPSDADMESVILALIVDLGESSGANTAPLYDEVQALFA
ncbi:hypothetical protein RSK20926_12244 [Roseobacter sp. SK209-2-6]|uniref:hypothetical protein n=1 Tax=Roseobacter sp. SK209-2-6 TaxID=388739 RepID=UPI0000F3C611|nr:hypothetical protein [Roseobacter sp. SK209-2-6]EBA18490.1 hypothetical protein RSK20926_12244 [Roseobacter sp. SK209-2-6]